MIKKDRIIDILPKIPQYEDIPYAGDFVCPDCGDSGFFEYSYNHKPVKPKAIGWCETNIGYMAIFECPCCGQKYRFHTTIGSWKASIEEFEDYFYYTAMKCSNWEEIHEQLND